ncbi:chromosome partitioning protein ParA [Planomonospora sphaerica]|uniref:Chromosome partitioning protein ParA n=1 Tax=Planomonospora sphaerica TaxID=161355 RepID=A0A171D851_9ACTN|nr:ParA family protein [Planomonospora sphaerica]GAT67787.1 chromosome partitioning protein ParA [Planomonospora sphaerica]
METERLDHAAEVKRLVIENARRHRMDDAEVYVTYSSYGGLRIRVVHPALAPHSENDRREKLLSGIDVEIAELLTPEEKEWYGPPFSEYDIPIPAWADVLERSESSEALRFASDLDADIGSPVIITFYSLRGGVGRTTALASTARILAARGRRVLCIDMDFEAPGLPYLFGLSEPTSDTGTVPLLLSLEQGESPDIRDHVVRARGADELYCLPAGRLDVDYAQRLRLIDPESWYRDSPNPLHALLDLAKESSLAPDIVLIDSRTGISAISAPLLFDVSDLAVICFFPHTQAEAGTELLVRSMLSAKTRRSSDTYNISPEPRFLVTPIPPGPSAQQVRDKALTWIDSWLSSVDDRRSAEVGNLQGDELTHFISYAPEVAFRDQVALTSTTHEVYGPIADWLEQLLPQSNQSSIVESVSKSDILNQLDFSTGTAEHQESFFEDFVKTKMSVQAMDPRYPLVIGRKGTGKTAVFRWLFEKAESRPIPVVAPNAFRDRAPWSLGARGFSAVERRLGARNADWQTFWTCYTALAAALSLASENITPADSPFDLTLQDLTSKGSRLDELDIVEAISKMIEDSEAALKASRWLRQMDDILKTEKFLLFDGLDTGFGNDGESRKRREEAVTGLFTFLTEIESRLSKLAFKVLLRVDIWQQLRFENKSHLYGRSIQLLWRDQSDYFKTILKQAVRSEAFKRALGAAGISSDVDQWQEPEVFRAWNLLVGERMKGGKTTFTRNWVWNRLADGQGDHGPRALSQLFHAAVDWEVREEVRSPYDRSYIRPRALVPSLESVSTEAVQSLHEEFPELDGLIHALETVGRTPLDPSEISGVDPEATGELDLALEVGLLAVHEGTVEEVRRYRVPDLYRHALGMSRRGQA